MPEEENNEEPKIPQTTALSAAFEAGEITGNLEIEDLRQKLPVNEFLSRLRLVAPTIPTCYILQGIFIMDIPEFEAGRRLAYWRAIINFSRKVF